MELLQFKNNVNGEMYKLNGSYSIEKGTSAETEYIYPVFEDITAERYDEGQKKFVSYNPTIHRWSGELYNAEDMLCHALFRYIIGSSEIEICSIDEGLREMADFYHSQVALTVKEKPIPKYTLYPDYLSELYQLIYVTDEYIYYGNGEDVIMLDAANHTVCSDNYFALVGLDRSKEGVCEGKETLLYDDGSTE